MANVIHFNFRLARYMDRLSTKFTKEQLAELSNLMAQAAALNDQIEAIYDRAVEVLGEESIEDENDRWAHDAIFNHSQIVGEYAH
jgi:hypothetical protein